MNRTVSILPLMALAVACASSGGTPQAESGRQPRVPTSAGSWIDLTTSAAWRGYRMDTLPSGWTFDAATGTITHVDASHDIITRQQFENFELELEWQVSDGANSGIFYRANEGTERIYENATEMQVLHNQGHADGRNVLTSAGSNYGLYAPPRDVTRPVGEWNTVRIVARGAHVEHWLNGVKVVEYEQWSDEWAAKVAAAKFRQWPTYGLARRGHIGLQEHGGIVRFRHLRIREIR